MNYIFAAIYVLGAILILLNVIQLFTLGWSWPLSSKSFSLSFGSSATIYS